MTTSRHPAASDLRRYDIRRNLNCSRSMASKKKSAKVLRCPTCKELVSTKGEDFPFCSDRCRKIDLGKWAMGVYKISSPVLDPEVLENLGEFGRRGGNHDDE